MHLYYCYEVIRMNYARSPEYQTNIHCERSGETHIAHTCCASYSD